MLAGKEAAMDTIKVSWSTIIRAYKEAIKEARAVDKAKQSGPAKSKNKRRKRKT